MTNPQQIALPLAIEMPPRFDNFIVGSNVLAVNALQQRPLAPIIFLWGAAGVGRTHLIQALAQQVIAQPAIAHETAPVQSPAVHFLLHDGYTPGALHLIDDVHLIDPAAQAIVFAVMKRVLSEGSSLVVTSPYSCPELQAQGMREDVVSRFASGAVFQLQALNDAEKKNALQHYVQQKGIPLGPELIDYCLLYLGRDMRSLLGFIHALDQFALAKKRRITVPLLRELLQAMPPTEAAFAASAAGSSSPGPTQ